MFGGAHLDHRAGAQTAHQQSEDPARRFVELLGAALTSGSAHVATAEGRRPENAGVWGWRENEMGQWEPKSMRIGWLDGDDLCLEPEAAYKAAQSMATDGSGIGVRQTTLWKRLNERGDLTATDKKRETLKVRRTIEGVKRAASPRASSARLLD